MAGRPVKYATPEKMQIAIDAYSRVVLMLMKRQGKEYKLNRLQLQD